MLRKVLLLVGAVLLVVVAGGSVFVASRQHLRFDRSYPNVTASTDSSVLERGQFYTRNLTPDAETGLGKVSDGAIARALRYGVGHDGRALLPFMEMQGLSDDDLQAVV